MKKIYAGTSNEEMTQFYIALQNKSSIKFLKLLYRIVDAMMVSASFPIFGKIATRIRVFFARRISPSIHKKSTIMRGAIINVGVHTEYHGNIGYNCLTCPEVYIGEHTMMGPNVHFYTNGHQYHKETNSFAGLNETPIKPIHIGKNCWIGYGVIILPGVTIADGCTVGAGSVVTKSCLEEGCLIAGNPATIKRRYLKE